MNELAQAKCDILKDNKDWKNLKKTAFRIKQERDTLLIAVKYAIELMHKGTRAREILMAAFRQVEI